MAMEKQVYPVDLGVDQTSPAQPVKEVNLTGLLGVRFAMVFMRSQPNLMP